VAERAVRYLRNRNRPVDSRALAAEVLTTRTPDEATATRVLAAAFGSDPRLVYGEAGWQLAQPVAPASPVEPDRSAEPDRTLIVIQGEPAAPGRPFKMKSVSVLRLQMDEVVSACGGDTVGEPYGKRLRRAILETLDGAVPVVHDPPGALRAFEDWLDEPLEAPISLRRLAQERVGLPSSHDLEALVERLGLEWREPDDPLEQADTLDACLFALRRPGETLQQLRITHGRGARPIDWSRYAFNREFLRRIPEVAGTYRFYDARGKLLYVGKSKNLHQRVGSYFREEGGARSERVQRLLDALHRIEYEAAHSDLEAMLREAEAIRRDDPERNVQRKVHARKGRMERLRSILILEPTSPPAVLQAYLIRDGRLIDKVRIGPRGGGLKRIERILDDHFFSAPGGPTVTQGPDVDVEVVLRWLSANRDRAVAFDPTDLGLAREVIDRLRWFLAQGSPFDTDGAPIFTR
jgi:hypothetical protein